MQGEQKTLGLKGALQNANFFTSALHELIVFLSDYKENVQFFENQKTVGGVEEAPFRSSALRHPKNTI